MGSRRLVQSLIFQSLRELSYIPTVWRAGPLIMSSYSPIGRDMLTGHIKSLEDLEQGDFRRMFPRFQPENLRPT